jgi:hypothetical protein
VTTLTLPVRPHPDDRSQKMRMADAHYEPHEIEFMSEHRALLDSADPALRAEVVNVMLTFHEFKVEFPQGRLLSVTEEIGLGLRDGSGVRAGALHPQHEQTSFIAPPADSPFQIPSRALEKLQESGLLPLGVPASEANARSTDPGTSHAAARSITAENMKESQRAVLDCFDRYGPMHDERFLAVYSEVRNSHGWPQQSESGLRTRRSELVDSRWMRDTGQTVTLPSNRQSTVWHITTRTEAAS